MKVVLLLLFLSAAASCAPPASEEANDRATVAVMAELRPGTDLDEMLALLDQHLVSAMTGRMDRGAVDDFRRAEAVTDRLLEARVPFEWIPAEQYSVQSRLRQIQSMADRVLALVETGASREVVIRELRTLRRSVLELRQAIARGGSRAPPSIAELLDRDSTYAPPGPGDRPVAEPRGEPREPRQAPRRAPLGTPVPPPEPAR